MNLSSLLNEKYDDSADGPVSGDTVSHAPPSDTVFNMDEWSIRQGEELFESSKSIQEAFKPAGVPDDPTNPDWVEKGEFKEIREASSATADFLTAAFEPEHNFAENPKNKRIERFMKNLLDTPEFKELHTETCMDKEASELAAVSFAKQWVALKVQEEPESELEKDIQAAAAARKAASAASEEVGEWHDMKDAIGLGSKGDADKISTEELQKRFKMIRSDKTLRRVMQLAGRYRRMAASMQRRKVFHGMDEAVGVTMGGDVSKLLPTEMSQLADEDFELLTMLRIVESSAMIRDFRGIEKVGKGPIVVVVDESGSMNGEPICQAKAYALAMYWIAKQQKRWCCLVGFSGSEDGNFLAIPPGEDKGTELLDWLVHFFGGGTAMDVPLLELPKRWKELGTPEGKTDIIQITDAECNVPKEIAESFNEWKVQHQAKFNVICVGESGDSLRCVADHIWSVDKFNADEDSISDSMMVV